MISMEFFSLFCMHMTLYIAIFTNVNGCSFPKHIAECGIIDADTNQSDSHNLGCDGKFYMEHVNIELGSEAEICLSGHGSSKGQCIPTPSFDSRLEVINVVLRQKVLE